MKDPGHTESLLSRLSAEGSKLQKKCSFKQNKTKPRYGKLSKQLNTHDQQQPGSKVGELTAGRKLAKSEMTESAPRHAARHTASTHKTQARGTLSDECNWTGSVFPHLPHPSTALAVTPPSPPRSLHRLKCQGSQTSEPLSKSSSPVWSLRSSLFRATQQCHPPPLSGNLSRETSPWQGHRSLSPTWEMAGSSQLQLLATFSDDLPGHSNAARKAKCTNPSLKCSFYFSFY